MSKHILVLRNNELGWDNICVVASDEAVVLRYLYEDDYSDETPEQWAERWAKDEYNSPYYLTEHEVKDV